MQYCKAKNIQYLIHEADPQSGPVIIIVSAYVIRPFVPTFQKKIPAKTMFAAGMTVGLAKWIKDDTCLVCLGK